MESVKTELMVGKESKEVVDFLVSVISHFKAGKSASELMELLPAGMEAVKGYDMLDDEVKSKMLGDIVGYLSSELVKVLTEK